MGDADVLAPGRQLRRQRPLAGQHEGGAVEDQLVLAAHLVAVDQRQPRLGDAGHAEIDPVVRLVGLEGRAVQDHEDLGAGFLEAFGHVLGPHVLAHHHPQAHAAEGDRPGQGAGPEHPLFVEHAVVRQIVLVAHRGDLAVLEQHGGVVEPAILAPGRAERHGRAAVAGLDREAFDRRLHAVLEERLEDQILGRIAAQHQLAEDDEIGVRARGLLARLQDLGGVAVDIAQDRVDLGDGDGEAVGHRMASVVGLVPATVLHPAGALRKAAVTSRPRPRSPRNSARASFPWRGGTWR